MLSDLENLVYGHCEYANYIEQQIAPIIFPSNLQRVFPQKPLLIKTSIHVDEYAANEGEDGRRVNDLKEGFVLVKGAMVF